MSGALLWICVALVGGIGALGRFVVDLRIERAVGGRFPLGTLVVNLTGAVALGLVVGARLHHDAALLVGSAALGSYTTFSTWMLESHRLAEDGAFALAWLNLALSVAAGLGAAELGRLIG